MSNPDNPRHLRPQKTAIRHVTTEAALRLVDEALALEHKDAIMFTTRLLQVAGSFAAMDEESRTSLLLRLIRKESNVEADLSLRNYTQSRDGRVFPERTNITSRLLGALPPADVQKAFWRVLAALGSDAGDADREERAVSSGRVATDFITRVKGEFSADDWRDIGARLLAVYAHDVRIPDDVRAHAVDSYFENTFKNVPYLLARAENDIAARIDVSPGYAGQVMRNLLELQPAIAGVILDERLGGAFRAGMFPYTSFNVCPEKMRIKVAELAYARGTDETLSEKIIGWLRFPRPRADRGAVDPYDVVDKVVREREDAPALQFAAMQSLLEQDSSLAPRSKTRSDIEGFIRAIDKIWQAAPNRAQPESVVYEMLARHPSGKKYMQKMTESDNALQRVTGVCALIRADPLSSLDQTVVQRFVNDVVAELKNVEHRPFCYTAVQRLLNWRNFSPGDMFVLRGLKKALKKLPDAKAADAAFMVDQVLTHLQKQNSTRVRRGE